MKITLEFEHPHELIDLLKKLGSNLNEDEPLTFDSMSVPKRIYDDWMHVPEEEL
jgi:hypothetical protein